MNRLQRLVPDVIVFVGLCLLALGVGWYQPGVGAAVLGAGLILAVRYGSR
jgi:hypothetical protein